jgi:putative ABC transport system permease protein
MLGLSIFSTEQRTKEIGVRKVMGASNLKVLQLVALDFLKLTLIALFIAIPSSIFLIRLLLKLFAERIIIGPDLFIIAAVIVILLTILTVSYQAIRSARSNPAGSLRYE